MFFFYTVPLIVCILAGIFFFTDKVHRNIALGLVVCILGFVPMLNVLFSCVAIVVLIVIACKNGK